MLHANRPHDGSAEHDDSESAVNRRDVLKTAAGAATLGALGTYATGSVAAAPSIDAAFLADNVDLNLYWQHDQAEYSPSTDTTFHVYQAVDTGGSSTSEEDSDGDAYMVAYDHSDGSVEGPVRVGYNDLSYGDTHGVPSMTIDGDGYIHVIFGDHANTGAFEYGRSENPYDISSWIHPPSGGSGSADLDQLPSGTYPSMTYDSGTDAVYVIYRSNNHDVGTLGMSSDNGENWTDINNGVINLGDSPWNHTDAYVTDLGAWAGRIHVSWAIAESDNHGDPRRNVYHAAYNPSTGNMENMDGASQGSTVSYSNAVNNCMVKDTTDIDVSSDGRTGSVYMFNHAYDSSTDTAYIPVHYPVDSSTSQLRVMSYSGVSTQSGSWQESSQITTTNNPERLNTHLRVNDSGQLEVKNGRGKDGLYRLENGTWNHYDYVAGTAEISKVQRPVQNGPDEFGWLGRDMGTTNGESHRIVYALGFNQPSGAGASYPKAPQNLRVTDTAGTTVTIDWDDGLAGPSGVTKFKVYVDGTHEKDVTAPPTGGSPYPRTWTDLDLGSAGTYDIEVSLVNGDSTESATSNTVSPTVSSGSQSPYGGTAWSIPGRIEAEDFDTGGEGVAYHDTSSGNSGNASYRSGEDVDISTTTDHGGTEYNVGYIEPGEWVEYTVDVDSGGTYDLDLRVASPNDQTQRMHVEVDGTDVTGLVDVPDTGDWNVWTTVTVSDISLSSGQHVVRMYFDESGYNVNYMEWSASSGSPYSMVDTTGAGNATFDTSGSPFVIDAAGHDVWHDADEYGAIYEAGTVDSSTEIVTTVESQENTSQYAKAGIMVANDVTNPGSSAGDVVCSVRPNNGFQFGWDSDGDGFVDSSTVVAKSSTSYPCKLRLTRDGNTFTGEYSTNGGSSWTTIDSVTRNEANASQDVALFVTSQNDSTKGEVEFSQFDVNDT